MYTEDYYERGPETGLSCYQSYRWMPEQTVALAMTIIDLLGIKPHHTILDYGCAKGYLVKAMRLLRRNCVGLDISGYAITNCDREVVPYVDLVCSGQHRDVFDFCIAKDVFEHVPKEELYELLAEFNCVTMFVVVPLGRNGRYNAPANNMDITHVVCEDIFWWKQIFKATGWKIVHACHRIEGIKESYFNAHPQSHGFFILRRGGMLS